jgi:hypothetical protein
VNRNDVLREMVAAVRRIGCVMTDKEAADRLAAAKEMKPTAVMPPSVYAGVVARLRTIKK